MDHCIFITIITIIYQNIELKGREKNVLSLGNEK